MQLAISMCGQHATCAIALKTLRLARTWRVLKSTDGLLSYYDCCSLSSFILVHPNIDHGRTVPQVTVTLERHRLTSPTLRHSCRRHRDGTSVRFQLEHALDISIEEAVRPVFADAWLLRRHKASTPQVAPTRALRCPRRSCGRSRTGRRAMRRGAVHWRCGRIGKRACRWTLDTWRWLRLPGRE